MFIEHLQEGFTHSISFETAFYVINLIYMLQKRKLWQTGLKNLPKIRQLINIRIWIPTHVFQIDSHDFSLTVLCCASLLSRVQLLMTPWTAARRAPLSMMTLQARILEWVAMPSSRDSSQPRDPTQFSHTADDNKLII